MYDIALTSVEKFQMWESCGMYYICFGEQDAVLITHTMTWRLRKELRRANHAFWLDSRLNWLVNWIYREWDDVDSELTSWGTSNLVLDLFVVVAFSFCAVSIATLACEPPTVLDKHIDMFVFRLACLSTTRSGHRHRKRLIPDVASRQWKNFGAVKKSFTKHISSLTVFTMGSSAKKKREKKKDFAVNYFTFRLNCNTNNHLRSQN